MSLRDQAEADLAVTLEPPGDFGTPFTLTQPDGFESATQLFGAANDIGQLIDPDTGQGVSGRHATLTARISTLANAGYTSLPEGIADSSSDPWIVEFAGLATGAQKYKVKETRPDRGLPVVTMVLEFWNEAA